MPITSYLHVSNAHPGTSRIFIPTCTSLRNLNSDVRTREEYAYFMFDYLYHHKWKK